MRRKKPQEMKRTNIDQKNQKTTKEKINKLERKKKEKRMKKDKIRRKKIKSRKAKKSAEKNKGRKKRKQGKGKNGKKMTWSWTSLNPPVSRRKTHPLHVRYAGGFERAFLAKLQPGRFPLSFPFLSPLSPFHGEDFPPALRPSGWHRSPEWNMNETNETNETRKKGEWNKWNMDETRGQHDHHWRLSCALVSVS